MGDVKNWYSDQHIFITGATGFMGKVLVEKLLRCCPGISTIYIIIRNKKGRTTEERLEDFLNCPVFDQLRDQSNNSQEKIFNKLRCLNGDITFPNLNLNQEDIDELQKKVTTVFHMAANVRFDQPLKNAVLLNTGGTLNVLELVCKFKNLKVFVHTSTSYCHCEETKLEEKLYSAPHNPHYILDLVQWMDSDLLTMLTPKLLGHSPNTYAYTKCLTEELVSEYQSKIPIVICRPSIVIAAWKEPFPGWVDNLNGPTGILVGAGKGVIRTMHCNAELIADVVPVDISVNSLLLAAWKIGNQPKIINSSSPVEVFHITVNHKSAKSWGETLSMGRRHYYNYPFSVCLWYPDGSPKNSYLAHEISAFFLHLVPAYLVDLILYLTNNKPFLIQTQKRIQNGLNVLQYYTTRPWYFINEKLYELFNDLDAEDKKMFYLDDGNVINDEFMKSYILGARKYCIHEEPETLPYARKILKRLYYLDMFKNILLVILLIWGMYVLITNLNNTYSENNNNINGSLSNLSQRIDGSSNLFV